MKSKEFEETDKFSRSWRIVHFFKLSQTKIKIKFINVPKKTKKTKRTIGLRQISRYIDTIHTWSKCNCKKVSNNSEDGSF